MRALRLASLALALALSACDAQVGPEYRGEPLATIDGYVVSQSALPEGEAVLLWANPGTSPDTILGVTAPVTNAFPARFTMPLYTPPPDAALMVDDVRVSDDGIAIGVITMARAGAALDSDAAIEAAMLGYCETHVVGYVANPLTPGGAVERWLGFRPAAGYHLLEVVRKTPAERDAIAACQQQNQDTIEACQAACADNPCIDACAAQVLPECGSTRDTFRAAPDGFATSVEVTTSPTQQFDWY